MLKGLSENLNMLMSKARVNSSELARHIGVPAATIKRIRNNEQANPTIATLLPIAEYFSISLNELISGESMNLITKSIEHFKIPVLSWQECIHYSLLDYKKCRDWVPTEKEVSRKAFALRVENQETENFRKDGLLLIETDIDAKNNDYVIVANVKNQIVSIRQYITEIDGTYLKPLVTGLGISTLTPELKIIGVIIQYKIELR